MDNIEKWEDVKGYEGYYQVSNKGQVRSMFMRKSISGNGRFEGGYTDIPYGLLPQYVVGGGYYAVYFSPCNDKAGCQKLVHRLVGEAFCVNTHYKPCIDHIDTNKGNNEATNLHWVTYFENAHNPITEAARCSIVTFDENIGSITPDTEEWRDVVGYEGYYQVSDKGHIRALFTKRYCGGRNCRYGNGYTDIAGAYLPVRVNKNGSNTVVLSACGEHKQARTKTVANCVAHAFIPNPYNHICVLHIGDKRDDSVDNLKWYAVSRGVANEN